MSDEGSRYLTDAEAGALVGKSAGQIRRLRLSGAFPYIPGRPTLIDRIDFEAWRATEEAAALSRAEAARLAARPWSELSPQEQRADARAWALRKKASWRSPRRWAKKPPGAT